MAAVTLRFSTAPEVRAKRDMWHEELKRHIIIHAVEKTSIAALQALTILVLDSVGSGTNPDSWGLCGFSVSYPRLA